MKKTMPFVCCAWVSVTLLGPVITQGQTSQGSIVAWGDNRYGQTNVPCPNTGFVAVAAGVYHSLGLKADGSIVAWECGVDQYGNNEDYGQCNVPAPNTDFIGIAAGGWHSLGLKADGSIVAWGCGAPYDYGQCNVPSPNAGFVAVAAGGAHSLGLKTDGAIVAWGDNNMGQTNVPEPNNGFIAVAGGQAHSLGLKTDGSIVGWGFDGWGQTNVPAPNTGFVGVAGGYRYSLGLKADGSIVGWGENQSGQTDVPAPNTGFVAVAAGGNHSLGFKADGSIVAWGWNGSGQTNVPAPNTGFVGVAAGAAHSLGLKPIEGADCNANGIPDECDITSGTSADCNANSVPDECEPLVPPAPVPDPSGIAKNRFISLSIPGGAGGSEQAVQVQLTSLHHVDPPYTGGSSIPFTAFEGRAHWVGPPTQYRESSADATTFMAATLQCQPHYQDWSTVGLLHVTGAEIVPSSLYDVLVLDGSCRGNEPYCLAISCSLTMYTTRWGDVESPYNPPATDPQPDTSDISAMVNKFKSAMGAPIKARALLAGGNARGTIGPAEIAPDFNFTHISLCVDAFKGLPYPYKPGKCTGDPAKACISDADCTNAPNPTTGPCILCP